MYKVVFLNHGQLYELYAKQVQQSDIPGFIEITGFVFADDGLAPNEEVEKIKAEFVNVTRSLVPLHAMQRIDVVNKEGVAKIVDLGPLVSNVHTLPLRDE